MPFHLLFHVLHKQCNLHKGSCFFQRCVKNLTECCHNSQVGQNLRNRNRKDNVACRLLKQTVRDINIFNVEEKTFHPFP